MPSWGSRALCDQADRHPTLIAASPLVVPPAPDWGPGVHRTGWLAPPPVVDVPSPTPELADFLARRPVHVGFGSLTAFTTEAEFDIVVEAARRSGVPVLTPAIVPYTLNIMKPTNDRLAKKAADTSAVSTVEAHDLIRKWVGMNLNRAIMTGTGTFLAAIATVLS